jgi:hypothetical protein
LTRGNSGINVFHGRSEHWRRIGKIGGRGADRKGEDRFIEDACLVSMMLYAIVV